MYNNYALDALPILNNKNHGHEIVSLNFQFSSNVWIDYDFDYERV